MNQTSSNPYIYYEADAFPTLTYREVEYIRFLEEAESGDLIRIQHEGKRTFPGYITAKELNRAGALDAIPDEEATGSGLPPNLYKITEKGRMILDQYRQFVSGQWPRHMVQWHELMELWTTVDHNRKQYLPERVAQFLFHLALTAAPDEMDAVLVASRGMTFNNPRVEESVRDETHPLFFAVEHLRRLGAPAPELPLGTAAEHCELERKGGELTYRLNGADAENLRRITDCLGIENTTYIMPYLFYLGAMVAAGIDALDNT